jgi:hypothetical protein
MAFEITQEYTFSFEPIELKNPDGKTVGTIGADFVQISSDEFEKLAEEGNEPLFRRIVRGLRGVQKDGADLPLDEAIKAAAKHPLLSAGILGGYGAGNTESFRQKKKKPK